LRGFGKELKMENELLKALKKLERILRFPGFDEDE
jgi:hypothetical protein